MSCIKSSRESTILERHEVKFQNCRTRNKAILPSKSSLCLQWLLDKMILNHSIAEESTQVITWSRL